MQVSEAQKRLGVAAAVATGLWALPTPQGLQDDAWHVFAIFVSCILGFLLRGFPMGAIVSLSLTALVLTKTLSLETALSGFADSTVWLVVAAFLIAGAVRRTGLGRRIALMLVHQMGRSTLGLGYAICAAETLLGPVVPSNTARGGGVMAPIVQSLARALGSYPSNSPQRGGAYLVQVGAHANVVTAAMYLTGMAANPMVAAAAVDIVGLEFGWGTWLLGSIVPALVSLAVIPYLVQRLSPAENLDATAAQREAAQQLQEMGGWTRSEKLMAGVFVLLLTLWSTSAVHGMKATTVAWVGICALVLFGAQSWAEFVEETAAWDTLVWLGGLLTMATALKDLGFITWAVDHVGTWTQGLPTLTTIVVLALVYFYSMYAFSMLTGHIAALVAAFFAVGVAAGVKSSGAALMMVGLFGYFSNLCASLTTYSTGPVIIYFGLGYVPAPTWMRNGALIATSHLVVWLTVGLAWWRLLGWW